jgi:hypothetical protein
MSEPHNSSGHGQQGHGAQPAANHGGHHGQHQHGIHQVVGGTGFKRPSTAKVEPIELEGGDDTDKRSIVSFGGESAHTVHDWKRPAHRNETGAVRVRSFHCRLSDQGLEFMDNSINHWLDAHPEVEVKFTSCVVGQFDGKLKEPAYILSLWY